jgi:hypothetical protein
VKHIMTEQTFFFETMLSVYGIVAYLLARTLALAILAAGTVLMTLTRLHPWLLASSPCSSGSCAPPTRR